MTQNQTSGSNLSGRVGTSLFLFGSTILVIYSAALAWQFQVALDSTAIESLGYFGSIGLASLHAVRIAVLDHAALLSVLPRILVLCSTLIVTLIGIALMPKRARGTNAPSAGDGSALPEGDQ
jgi:hypothetical protein